MKKLPLRSFTPALATDEDAVNSVMHATRRIVMIILLPTIHHVNDRDRGTSMRRLGSVRVACPRPRAARVRRATSGSHIVGAGAVARARVAHRRERRPRAWLRRTPNPLQSEGLRRFSCV